MVDAAPFRALRYDPDVVGDVRTTSAPAVDDIDRFDYARHRTASPYTVLELLAPRAGDGFAAASAALHRWLRTGVLTLDRQAGFYVYEQRMPPAVQRTEHVQRGVLAAVRVEEGYPRRILPHEDIDPERLMLRIERLRTVPVDLAPVFTVTTELDAEAGELLASALRRPPLVALIDEAGTAHRVVACRDPEEVAALRASLAEVAVLIADGHHRYAAAAALHPGSGDGRTMMLIADASRSEPLILPVHRLVPALPADWPDRLAPDFVAQPAPLDAHSLLAALAAAPDGTIALRSPGSAFLLAAREVERLRSQLPATRSAAWRALDTALVDAILLPRLGVDPGAVRYRPDLAAVAEVDRREAGGLLLVQPVPFTTVGALAAAGERLPPKTTSFRPKPRTGLVMRMHNGKGGVGCRA